MSDEEKNTDSTISKEQPKPKAEAPKAEAPKAKDSESYGVTKAKNLVKELIRTGQLPNMETVNSVLAIEDEDAQDIVLMVKGLQEGYSMPSKKSLEALL